MFPSKFGGVWRPAMFVLFDHSRRQHGDAEYECRSCTEYCLILRKNNLEDSFQPIHHVFFFGYNIILHYYREGLQSSSWILMTLKEYV